MASIASSSTSTVSDKQTLPGFEVGFLKSPRRLLSAFLVITKAIGWGIINFIVTSKKERRPERPKIAIDGRKWVSLSRCLGVHILPVCGTITIFWLNGVNYYIGGNLAASSNKETDKAYLNALQVAAKAQELLVLASLATMVADYVRYHACLGDGVPFAALTASFSFTSLGYIYSPEYCSVLLEIPSGSARRVTRKVLFAIFLLAVTVAGALIGPATAITIIPAIDWFPAGSPVVNITLPVGITSSALPLTLRSNNVPANCSNAEAALSDPPCPAAGYYSIMSWARSIGKRDPLYYKGVQQYNPKVVGSDFATEIIFQPIFELRRYFNIIRCGQPKYREMAVLLEERRAWHFRLLNLSNYGLGRFRYRFRSDARVSFRSEAPRTLVICNEGVAFANSTVLGFPIPLSPEGWETDPDAEKLAPDTENNEYFFSLANITTGGAPIIEKWAEWAGVNTTTRFQDPKWRLQWVRAGSVAHSDPGIASARAVVYALILNQPGVEINNTSRIVYTCSILSHWLPSTSSIDVNLDVSIRQFTSKQTIEHEYAKTSITNFYNGNGTLRGQRAYIDQDPIMLETDWLDALTPNIMPPQDYNTRGRELTIESTLLDSLGSNATSDNFSNDLAISSILCATVSDGLSRVNTKSLLYPSTSEDSYPLDLNFEVQGYGYKTDSRTSQWALALLGGHLLLVLIHVGWTITICRSFKAWETFSEVIALVLNSDKSDIMDNCCAGIERFHTLRNTVLIREVGEDKRLGLVFSRDVDAAGLKLEKVSADEKYPIF
ncbi:hypothetical protein EYR41_012045 [Orbilia oligospora]|uniref:Uncharacterized protein n=1 Tax=Orbilia oligospora TaxID=2813651 RepID=A0A7C8P2F8_ORBOL|nr:hypothetical protein TWF751_004518 [Orbilia oligospora]TGJ62866.1 hypothetical protein EYR41_012045 [Orbilia oligospora]